MNAPTDADLLAALDAEIPPSPTTPLYRLGIVLVMVAMVLLPLLYAALIGGIGYGMVLHATQNQWLITETGGGTRGRALLYVGPLVVGAIGVLFMVKPLIAPRAKRPTAYTLDPDRYPLVFQFVERLCRTVRAPMPTRIDVDVDVNASASFRRGYASFLGNDLVLTIGLPLVEGLTLQQLTGVMAHEFGHFAQGSGLRLTYVIRSINAWFARVVFERDAWDAMLAKGTTGYGLWVQMLIGLSRWFVWLTRAVLFGLMQVGHLISSFLLRQLEFDADRYEVRVAGSDAFEQTADRLVVLGVANEKAHADLGRAWLASRLADDLPTLVVVNAQELAASPNGESKGENPIHALLKSSREQPTRLFHTHPSNGDRIAAARAMAATGIFHIDAPASRLFPDHKELYREVTLQHYRDGLGLKVGPEQLVPSETLAAESADELEGLEALNRYLQGCPMWSHGFRLFLDGYLPGHVPSSELPTALAELAAARARMLAALPDIREAMRAYQVTVVKADATASIASLMDAGIGIPSTGYMLNDKGRADAAASRQRAAEAHDLALRRLGDATEPVAARLTAALKLRGVAPTPGDEPVQADRIESSCATLAILRDGWPPVQGIMEHFRATIVLLENLEGQKKKRELAESIRIRAGDLLDALQALRDTLRGAPYPFAHGSASIALGDHLVPELPPVERIGDVLYVSEACIERYQALYARVLADLVRQAERIEVNAGLARLDEPDAGARPVEV